MKEVSRFLLSFALFLTALLAFAAAVALYGGLTEDNLPAPLNLLWTVASGLVLLGCVVGAVTLLRRLRR